MDDATRMALASAELQKGLGHIKATISLLSPIDRPSLRQTTQKLIYEMLDIEALVKMVDQ